MTTNTETKPADATILYMTKDEAFKLAQERANERGYPVFVILPDDTRVMVHPQV